MSKSGTGSVLDRFGIRIRILHEKLYRVIDSDQFVLRIFANPIFYRIGVWLINVSWVAYISHSTL